MNTDFLRTFLDVVETGSFTRSAHRLHVSQSTISSRVQELEREMGQALFVRLRDRVEPTAAGNVLLGYAKGILFMERSAVERLNAMGRHPERLTVGCVHAFYDCFPENVQGLREAFPDSAFRLILKHSHEVLDRTLDGDFDVGFTHHPSNQEGYACELLYRDTMLLIARSADRRCVEGVRPHDLPGLPILYSGFLDTHTVKQLFGGVPSFEFGIDVGSKVVPYILNEDKYAFLPRRLIEGHPDSGALAAVPLLGFELPPLENFALYSLRHPYAEAIRHALEKRQRRQPHPPEEPSDGSGRLGDGAGTHAVP